MVWVLWAAKRSCSQAPKSAEETLKPGDLAAHDSIYGADGFAEWRLARGDPHNSQFAVVNSQ